MPSERERRREIISGFSQFIKIKDYGVEIKMCVEGESKLVGAKASRSRTSSCFIPASPPMRSQCFISGMLRWKQLYFVRLEMPALISVYAKIMLRSGGVWTVVWCKVQGDVAIETEWDTKWDWIDID